MLNITVGGSEYYDSEKQEFFTVKEIELKLEHSLLSIAKWESVWNSPFLYMIDDYGRDTKTKEQTISYIQCMTLNKNVSNEIYKYIGNNELLKINEYINSELTATWFNEPTNNSKTNKTKLTSELIYYLMTVHQIPWDAEKWHLSRLFTLLRICDIKSRKEKKMTRAEQLQQQRSLNSARKQANRTQG